MDPRETGIKRYIRGYADGRIDARMALDRFLRENPAYTNEQLLDAVLGDQYNAAEEGS